MNPPYNKGADIDFIFLAKDIAKENIVAITPAKWQTAEANQRIASGHSYGDFRRDIVPYMAEIIFYTNCSDIFLISQDDGITYYKIDKNKNINLSTLIKNKCKHQKYLNSTSNRVLNIDDTLHNYGQELINYLNNIFKDKFKPSKLNTEIIKLHTVVCNNRHNIERGVENTYQAYGMVSYATGKMSVICAPRIVTNIMPSVDLTNADTMVFSSDSYNECESIISWINSKFVRYLVSINISSISPVFSDKVFKFIPAPPTNLDGTYDWSHPYTDEFLYHYYGLDKPEAQTSNGIRFIDIIESVIKERKPNDN